MGRNISAAELHNIWEMIHQKNYFTVKTGAYKYYMLIDFAPEKVLPSGRLRYTIYGFLKNEAEFVRVLKPGDIDLMAGLHLYSFAFNADQELSTDEICSMLQEGRFDSRDKIMLPYYDE